MAASYLLCAFIAFSSLHFVFSQDPPEQPPSPAPAANVSAPFPPPESGSPSLPPSQSPGAPPPSGLTPIYTPPAIAPASPEVPAPAPGSPEVPAPAPGSPEVPPAPAEERDVNHIGNAGSDEASKTKGMNGGKKVGIAIGLIMTAAVVGFGAVVYKRRQQNIRRSQYAYSARRDLL
ncbi:hypothetical protein K2173_016475 [Erythroxylum novogranatense]|uniref:Uncharacterized protein n=1 Tax=Erythroxylum novogranatense TaxID=1862640 RepID=A0AAV8SH21_9ROSI|nr:hypothetical protein K2173_016475 [Erythroxylum novogranatense]